MRGIRSRSGLTIVELIIAAFILTIILGIVGSYLAKQSQLNRVTLAASEVQDKTRLVMQLVIQDLQLGGAKTFVDNDGQLLAGWNIPSCPSNGTEETCLVGWDGGARDSFSTVYVNTLRAPGDSCREVGYRFVDNILYRADRHCDGTADLLDPVVDAADYGALAMNVLGLDIEYKCSDAVAMSSYPDGTNCPIGAGYLRSAVVTVVARATNPTDGSASKTYSTVSGQTITCPQDYRCFSIQQEVLMPNFKDR